MEEEILDLFSRNAWDRAYIEIRSESMNNQYTTYDAMKPENRCLNRYRDVLPYDHSRVAIKSFEVTDYINASLVKVPRANRSYILSQGPLASTVGHFWLTVWQQRTKAVLMLNRVMEKGQVKCHQYWPELPGQVYDLEEVGLKLEHLSSEPGDHYTVRTLRLTHEESGESREIFHFHYTTWPDFGVPQCPDTFLEFLNGVRASGSLNEDVGPAVVHCSAGIGRSGTFCLVDSCLVVIAKEGPESVKIKDILLQMRSYRMGLIQTPDQLKFSYIAIAAGASQAGLVAANKLSEVCRSQTSGAKNNSASSSSSSSDDEDFGPPPLPPPRSESLKVRELDPLQDLIEDLDDYLLPTKNGCGGGEDRQPKSAGAVLTGAEIRGPVEHKHLTASMSAGAVPSKSPTKCILNNFKLEERKKEMELRRRQKEEKRVVTEAKIAEIKKGVKEAEEWSNKRKYVLERAVPFCVGLAMFVIGGYCYYTR